MTTAPAVRNPPLVTGQKSLYTVFCKKAQTGARAYPFSGKSGKSRASQAKPGPDGRLPAKLGLMSCAVLLAAYLRFYPAGLLRDELPPDISLDQISACFSALDFIKWEPRP
jgi:hypothetical protein